MEPHPHIIVVVVVLPIGSVVGRCGVDEQVVVAAIIKLTITIIPCARVVVAPTCVDHPSNPAPQRGTLTELFEDIDDVVGVVGYA